MWADLVLPLPVIFILPWLIFLKGVGDNRVQCLKLKLKRSFALYYIPPPQILPLTTVGMGPSETQKYNLLCYLNNKLMNWNIDMCLHFASHHKLVRNKAYIFLILALCYLFLNSFNFSCQFLCYIASNCKIKVNVETRRSVEEQAVQSQCLPWESEDKYWKHQSGYAAFRLTIETSWPQIWKFWKMS